MNFLDRGDEKWLELTLDSKKRVQRIKRLSELRPILFWCMIAGMIAALCGSVASSFSANPKGGGALLFGLLMPIWLYSGMDQELRLLKLVGRLPGDNVPRSESSAAN